MFLPQGGDRTDLVNLPGKTITSLRSGWDMELGKSGGAGGKRGGRNRISI